MKSSFGFISREIFTGGGNNLCQAKFRLAYAMTIIPSLDANHSCHAYICTMDMLQWSCL